MTSASSVGGAEYVPRHQALGAIDLPKGPEMSDTDMNLELAAAIRELVRVQAALQKHQERVINIVECLEARVEELEAAE